MNQVKLSEISVERIKNRELEEVIPELYELEGIIENNRSHNNDPVFNHTITVLIELEKLFERANKRIKNYLAQKVNSHSRRELLFFVTVYHDIGKKETLKKEGNTIQFPGHEEMSAEKIQRMMPKFDLSENEKEIVIQTIRNHGFFHNVLDHPEDDLDKKTKEFKEKNSNAFLEVVLLTIADIFGGHLRENNPEEFKFRIDFLNKIIECY